MTTPISPTAQHLAAAIERSPKTQRDIAKEAGFRKPNVLSMMKSGESKVPIRRIPSLSSALGIAPAPFLQIALREYHPDIYDVLSDFYGIGLSPAERILLELYDEAQHVAPFEMDAGLCNLILELMVYSGRLQQEAEAE